MQSKIWSPNFYLPPSKHENSGTESFNIFFSFFFNYFFFYFTAKLSIRAIRLHTKSMGTEYIADNSYHLQCVTVSKASLKISINILIKIWHFYSQKYKRHNNSNNSNKNKGDKRRWKKSSQQKLKPTFYFAGLIKKYFL